MQAIQKAFMQFKTLETARAAAIKAESETAAREEEQRKLQDATLKRRNSLLQLTSPIPSPEYEVTIGTFNVVVRVVIISHSPPIETFTASWICHYP